MAPRSISLIAGCVLLHALAVVGSAWSAPPNDDCVDATVVDQLPFRDCLNTADATSSDADPPLTCTAATSATVWYRFTSEFVAPLCAHACAPYDSTIAVFSGTCDAPTEIACIDDDCGCEGCSGQQSKLEFFLPGGVPFWIVVARSGSGPGGPLRFRLADAFADTDGDGIGDCTDSDADGDGLDDCSAQVLRDPPPAFHRHFGSAVAAAGDDALVGASSDQTGLGTAHLFDGRTGKILQGFFESPPAPGSLFGAAVGAVGDRVVIGAPSSDIGGQDAGTAYLFERSGTLVQRLMSPSPAAGDRMGVAVTSIGSEVFVGAPGKDAPGAGDAGAVYVFDGATGLYLRTLPNPMPAAGDQFGAALAAAPGGLLVGAPFRSSAAENAGVAYLLDPATGQRLRTYEKDVPAAGDLFGAAVSGFGADVVIGAPFEDRDGLTDVGGVYRFAGATGSPKGEARKVPGDGGDLLGASLGVHGGNLVVGAPGDDAGRPGSGAVYLFEPNNVLQSLVVVNPTPGTADRFGYAVATTAGRLLIGAPDDDDRGEDAGAAYLISPCGNGIIDRGEQCDDGNQVDGDGCDSGRNANCSPTGCGNGVRTDPEECDGASDACRPTTCQPNCFCGRLCGDLGGALSDRLAAAAAGVVPCCGDASEGDSCDDGDPCTDFDACDASLICHGTQNTCDDNVGCTADACDDGHCVHVPVDSRCSSGGPCTAGYCDPDLPNPGCKLRGSSVQCQDTTVCNGTEICKPCTGCRLNTYTCCATGVKCEPGEPPQCDDRIPCTSDVCDATLGCTHSDDGCDCSDSSGCSNDNNPCTADTCVNQQCEHTPLDGVSCSDGNLCNGEEMCREGECTPGTPMVCSNDDPCVEPYCDPVIGCSSLPASCFDGVECALRSMLVVDACRTQTVPPQLVQAGMSAGKRIASARRKAAEHRLGKARDKIVGALEILQTMRSLKGTRKKLTQDCRVALKGSIGEVHDLTVELRKQLRTCADALAAPAGP